MKKLSILFIFLLISVNAEHFAVEVTDNQTINQAQNCTCVPYYQCAEDIDKLITNGKGLLDERKLDASPCKGYFDVCCNATIDVNQTAIEEPIKLTGCGYQNSGFFPWEAALFYKELEEFPPIHQCGVSLLHEKAAITAAHCLDGDGSWLIKFGNIVREISEHIIHPNYNKGTLQFDIALLILEKPVALSEKINTICIPPKGTMLENSKCTATARTSDANKGSYMTILKLPIVPNDQCLKSLRATRLGKYFQLHSSFLCAGGLKNEDTCGGDGGTPLVCPVPGQPGRYHQAGIVSWGIGCRENDTPGVYVNLPLMRDWIDREMIKRDLSITTYRY